MWNKQWTGKCAVLSCSTRVLCRTATCNVAFIGKMITTMWLNDLYSIFVHIITMIWINKKKIFKLSKGLLFWPFWIWKSQKCTFTYFYQNLKEKMQFHLQTTDMIIEMLFWSLENNVLFNYFEMYILLLHTAWELSQWGVWRSVTSKPEALPLRGFLAASMTSDLWDWSTHPRDLWFCLSRAQKYPFLGWGQHIPSTTVDGVNLLLGKGLWAPAASHQVSDIFALIKCLWL